jgi:26S proteasome regulatory subunit N3
MAWRKKLTPAKLVDFLHAALDDENPSKAGLVALAGGAGSPPPAPPTPPADGAPAPAPPPAPVPPSAAQRLLPETEAYAHLLCVLFLTDAGDARVVQASERALSIVSAAAGRRATDALGARLAFYYALAHERHGSVSDARATLLRLHRAAVTRRDDLGQETCLNLLLRNYLHYSEYEQAEKLRSKAQTPSSRSNPQQCRHLYYLGRIRAVQLEYSEAKACLQQAHRKAPAAARGFAVELTKWITVVRLLLGEIPEKRDLFPSARGASASQKTRDALAPYAALAQAVRAGDLAAFKAVAETHAAAFAADKTHLLVARLRRNVIRVGLRRVSLAYSSISLSDVAAKLGLATSAEDVERVVAKAIRDGGVDASLDHERQLMVGAVATDAYATREPQAAFHARIAFCLDAHNEAVRAMRYPPAAREAKRVGHSAKDVLALEEELATHIMEDDEMDEF